MTDDKRYTLNEAMHLALDGAKVCHDVFDSAEYMFYDNQSMQHRLMLDDGSWAGFSSNGSNENPKSGWHIYKEPVVTYKGRDEVFNAVFDKFKTLYSGNIRMFEHRNTLAIEVYNNGNWEELTFINLDIEWTEKLDE